MKEQVKFPTSGMVCLTYGLCAIIAAVILGVFLCVRSAIGQTPIQTYNFDSNGKGVIVFWNHVPDKDPITYQVQMYKGAAIITAVTTDTFKTFSMADLSASQDFGVFASDPYGNTSTESERIRVNITQVAPPSELPFESNFTTGTAGWTVYNTIWQNNPGLFGAGLYSWERDLRQPYYITVERSFPAGAVNVQLFAQGDGVITVSAGADSARISAPPYPALCNAVLQVGQAGTKVIRIRSVGGNMFLRSVKFWQGTSPDLTAPPTPSGLGAAEWK